MGTKLRVGILADKLRTPAWASTMLERILEEDSAEFVLVVLNTPDQDPTVPTQADSAPTLGARLTRKILKTAVEKVMERVPYEPDAFEPKSLEGLLSGVPVLRVVPIRKRASDYFKPSDIETIRAYELDVLIRLGFRILRGDVLKCARYGIWSYHHGDNRVNRGGPAGFWEAADNWRETGSILQILTEDLDGGQVLYRSWAGTQPSVGANKNSFYWKSASFLPRKLKELHAVGKDEFFRRIELDNAHPSFYSNQLFRAPTTRDLACVLRNQILKKLRGKLTSMFFFDQWILMYRMKPRISSSFWRFKKIMPPKDRFWADPHVIYRNGRYHIFLEEYIYASRKGHISLVVMDEQGRWAAPVIVLERPYHLSYPYVFEWDDGIFMVPETSARRTIELYKCVEFPDKWEFATHLMEGVHAVDATLHRADGVWWMFVNMVENRGGSSCDELFLFYSDTLITQDWTPHPCNPIVSDAKRSRPAGRIFEHNGHMYRPAQDCSYRYGYGMNIHEIKSLTTEAYEEELVAAIEPNWDKRALGTHTFSHSGNLTIIDCLYRRRR